MSRRALSLPLTLRLGLVPAEWAAEHGYGEMVMHHYGRGRSSTGLRWTPGIDAERVIFHYLNGRPAPCNYTGRAGAQWEYPTGAGRTRAEQKAAAMRLAAPAKEEAWTRLLKGLW